jgi:hypothetical protein
MRSVRNHNVYMVVSLLLTVACQPRSTARTESGPIVMAHESLSAFTPCAERLVVKNSGRVDETIRVDIGYGDPPKLLVRRPNPDLKSLRFSSRVFKLPTRGVAGFVITSRDTMIAFDSRSAPPCAKSLADATPERLPDEFGLENSLYPRGKYTGRVAYPGLVMVIWKQPVDSAAADALLNAEGAWIVARTNSIAGAFVLWFDGDDSSGRLAERKAKQLSRSPLIRSAIPYVQDWDVGVP